MPIEQLRGEIARVLREMGVAEPPEIVLERPRNPDHGDFASNVAMALARPLQRPPRQIAEELVQRIDVSGAGIRSAEVAGPGFINFRLTAGAWQEQLRLVHAQGDGYGRNGGGGGRHR